MRETGYNNAAAVQYAQRWATSRNSDFYDYSEIGGDCTSFASQCVYAGCGIMNYTPTFGWYYISPDNKSPSWSGVQYFYNFMTTNDGAGPYAEEAPLDALVHGDIIQLARNNSFYHTLVLTMIKYDGGEREYYVSAHDVDAYRRNLATYSYEILRGIHMLGARRQ